MQLISPRKRVCLPPIGPRGETHSLVGRGRGPGYPIPTMGQTLWYSSYNQFTVEAHSTQERVLHSAKTGIQPGPAVQQADLTAI
jgi:hypothetical protein